MADKRVLSRMKKELERLKKDPPHGVTCWCKQGKLNCLEANLLGAEGTPYEGGVFKLDIQIPNNYPFQPPHVRFLTQIYHPNIDTAGRICLDVLKSPPTGSWKPAHNLHTILTSIQLLVAEPNPDDGLMADISSEYKQRRPTFNAKAKEWTHKYAMGVQPHITGDNSATTPELKEETNTAIPGVSESMSVDRSNDTVKLKGLGEGSNLAGLGRSQIVILDDPCVACTKEESTRGGKWSSQDREAKSDQGKLGDDTSQDREVILVGQDLNQDGGVKSGQDKEARKKADQKRAGQDERQRSGQDIGMKRKRLTGDEEEEAGMGHKKKFFIEL